MYYLFPFRHFFPLIAFHLPSFSTDTEVFFLDFASKTFHGSELSICLTSDAMNGEVISVPGVQAEESVCASAVCSVLVQQRIKRSGLKKEAFSQISSSQPLMDDTDNRSSWSACH